VRDIVTFYVAGESRNPMSFPKIAEVVVLLGLPVLAFFDNRHSKKIWQLWFATAALVLVLVVFGIQK
jgi:hypothetical protein